MGQSSVDRDADESEGVLSDAAGNIVATAEATAKVVQRPIGMTDDDR